MYSNSQACSVQSLKSWFASHSSAWPDESLRRALRFRERHRVFHRDQLALAAAGIVGIDQQFGLGRIEAAVDQRVLHVVPAHVRHEQADVVIALLLGLRDVDEARGRVTHLVELQNGERRRLLPLAESGLSSP